MYCQLVYICGCIPARIRHALADLPETLDETYERTLREINEADWEFAHRLFQFIAVAVRPLLVEELAELLAFDFKAGSIPKFHEDWRLEDPMHAVLSTCPSFLAIVDENPSWPSERKVVQFSHFSVKEFLTSRRLDEANDISLHRYHISETPAHTLAASACLGYLLHVDKDVTNDSLEKLPLAEYSAKYWVDHARLEDVSRNVEDGWKELFDPSKTHLSICAWIEGLGYRRSNSGERLRPFRGTPLHYAALWNLHPMVKFLIDELSQNVNSQNFTDSTTPLHVASKEGHVDITRRLLDCDADLEARDKYSMTPLHAASVGAHPEVVRILIERGASVSSKGHNGCTPLHLACKAEVAQILIESGADVSAQDMGGNTPLHGVNYVEVARILIERGANVSAQDKEGWTPLHRVSGSWDEEEGLQLVGVFIEHGADVSAQDKAGRTPLHGVRIAGIARKLIEHGADVSARESVSHHTPLHLVSLSEWLADEVVEILFERGADISAQDKNGRTPLHMAREVDVVRMLIECGADASAQDKAGHTPLHMAWQAEVARRTIFGRGVDVSAVNHTLFNLTWGQERVDSTQLAAVARVLIERGAGVSAQDKDGRTPLHLAWHPEVARVLIKHGADVSAQDKDGHTPLHLAWHAAVTCVLIEHGADVSAQDKDGHTPLHLAWHPDVTRVLIGHGADVSAQDKDGHTPLHLVSHAWDDVELARTLIERGADVSAQDKEVYPPEYTFYYMIWEAEEIGPTQRAEVARVLIERGVGVSAQDKDGRTPLHLAWHPEVACVLIEHDADVSAQDKDGHTPLHLAWHAEVTCVLIEHGADVSAQDKDGRTPLHLVWEAGVAHMLIKHGADVSAKDNDGHTPLHVALQAGRLEVARILIGCGADVSWAVQDKRGQSPIYVVFMEFGLILTLFYFLISDTVRYALYV